MEINLQEAKLILAALHTFQDSARSDEPHWSHNPEFAVLFRKVYQFTKTDETELKG